MVRIKRDQQQVLRDLLPQLALARHNMLQAKEAFDKLQDEVTTLMEALQQKTVDASTSMGNFQFTYVRPNRVKVDENGLREALGDEWYKLTSDSLDRKKLEQALNEDTVDPEIVSKFLKEEVGSSYLRISEKKDDGDA